MPKHRKFKHYKSTTCHRTFILHGRRQHEYGSEHVQHVKLKLRDRAQLGPPTLPESLGQLRISSSVTSRESIDSTEMRRKYGGLIRTLLCAIPDTADGVEVRYATQEQIRSLVHQSVVFRKLTVIRPHKNTISMPVDAIIKRIKEGSDIRAKRSPLLDLKRSGQGVPTSPPHPNASPPCSPDNLHTPWDKVQWRNCRREAGPRENRLPGSMSIVRTNLGRDGADMAKFADEGDDWAPKTVAAIVLEPGDILIMPPAKIVPQVVLTLEDLSHDSAQKFLWITTHTGAANEAIPLQLLSG
ncbi:hypothetical protein PCL_11266 [Purpureocillium lilacinum]|uniref:Uncharacterized protein n=1 Tax=Purpureocillium lilacinum TaxID=33203 RepID=A0A2U3DPZ0_PURLI|nr:hypothetical protein PCL_11266 [Purpureocillium lilacinum]